MFQKNFNYFKIKITNDRKIKLDLFKLKSKKDLKVFIIFKSSSKWFNDNEVPKENFSKKNVLCVTVILAKKHLE